MKSNEEWGRGRSTRTLRHVVVAMCALTLAPMPAGGIPPSDEEPSTSAGQYSTSERFRAGVEALERKEYAAAEGIFADLVRIAPTDAASLYRLGQARAGRENWAGAIDAFSAAVAADPGFVAAYPELARSQRQLGLVDEALRTRSTLDALLQSCGNDCAQRKEIDAAAEAMERIFRDQGARLDPPKGLLFSSEQGDHAYLDAVSLINERRFEEAMASLRTAARSFGPHPDILTYMGYVNRKLGDYAEAEAHYLQALAVQPNHRSALEYYGELKVIQGDRAAAESLLSRLEEDCPYDCAEAEELRRWLGG